MKVTIEGVPGFDGEYPFDISYFTNGELHTIKKISGVRAGEIEEAFEAGDNDLFVALATIAAERNGKKIPVGLLWDADAGKIKIEDEEAEAGDVEVPPDSPPPSGSSSGGD